MNIDLLINGIIEGFSKFMENLNQILPNLFSSVVVFVFGILLAYTFRFLSKKVIFFSPKIFPKEYRGKWHLEKDIHSLASVLSRLIFFMTIFLFSIVALNRIGRNFLSEWLQELAKHLPNLVASVILILLGWKLSFVLRNQVFNYLTRVRIRQARVLSNILAITILSISIIMALDQFGLELDFLNRVIGIFLASILGCIALSFAIGSSATISNILAGYQIQQQVKVGDTIKIDDVCGEVISIQPTFVIVANESDKVIIPAKKFSEAYSTVCGKKIK